jgi:hypothetical protein
MSAGFHTSGSIALTTLSIQSKHTVFFSSRQKSYLSTVNCFLGQSGSSLFLYSPETVICVLNPQRPRQSLSCTRFVKSYKFQSSVVSSASIRTTQKHNTTPSYGRITYMHVGLRVKYLRF